MLRFFVALSLVIVGYSYQAQAQLSVSTADRTMNGGSRNNGSCPYADGGIVITAEHTSKTSGEVTLTIKCAPNANDAKTQRYTSKVALNSTGSAESEVITLADHNMNKGDHCTVEASIDNETATADFKVTYKQINGSPQAEISEGGIEAGKEFKIGNLHFTSEIPFFDLLLRECAASSDPWMFWTDRSGTLHRVYPTSTNSESRTTAEDKDTTNDNHCLGAYDGELRHLVTIGDDHTACKFKLIKEDVIGGGSFTEQGDPALATVAAVTVSNGKVMVHTGSKPSTPTGIENDITVFVSTNRGFTWKKSDSIEEWTSQTTDSGIAAAEDNTRNMAMIKITKDTNVWWRIIKGQ